MYATRFDCCGGCADLWRSRSNFVVNFLAHSFAIVLHRFDGGVVRKECAPRRQLLERFPGLMSRCEFCKCSKAASASSQLPIGWFDQKPHALMFLCISLHFRHRTFWTHFSRGGRGDGRPMQTVRHRPRHPRVSLRTPIQTGRGSARV